MDNANNCTFSLGLAAVPGAGQKSDGDWVQKPWALAAGCNSRTVWKREFVPWRCGKERSVCYACHGVANMRTRRVSQGGFVGA